MRKPVHVEVAIYAFVVRSVSKVVEERTDLANINGFFRQMYKRRVKLLSRVIGQTFTPVTPMFSEVVQPPMDVN